MEGLLRFLPCKSARRICCRRPPVEQEFAPGAGPQGMAGAERQGTFRSARTSRTELEPGKLAILEQLGPFTANRSAAHRERTLL